MDREQEIRMMIPKDVKTMLDVGSSESFFKNHEIITLDIENADIVQDLNVNQKIKMNNKSVDMVVLSQILEHLPTVDVIVKESKRITKKYILVGLPNEMTIDNRIRFLIGTYYYWGGYFPYGHKHFFKIDTIEKFIKQFFGKYNKKKYIFGMTGGRYIHYKVRRWLCNTFPTLFAGQVYYLIKE